MSVLATARAASAAAGAPTVWSAPALPAAATNSVPCSAERLFTACDSGSVPSVPPPPRLMLTMRARGAAHSMPAMMAEVGQVLVLHTLPMTREASGAMPRKRPSEATPEPAMVPATWVPCPTLSLASGRVSVKSTASRIRPARSGWSAATPVSSTATVTPSPVRPAVPGGGRADEPGALVEQQAQARVQPHLVDPARPAARGRRPAPPVIEPQKAPAFCLSATTASAWMLARKRRGEAPLTASRPAAGAALVGDDDGQGGLAAVVEPLADQQAHVEQLRDRGAPRPAGAGRPGGPPSPPPGRRSGGSAPRTTPARGRAPARPTPPARPPAAGTAVPDLR